MERARPAAPAPEAEDFVRFCYRRRRVGWPELYDEMCHVATRGTFRGMGHAELAEVGIGFSLFDTRQLAELVIRVVSEEQAERARLRAGIRIVRSSEATAPAAQPAAPAAPPGPPAPMGAPARAEDPSPAPPLALAVRASA